MSQPSSTVHNLQAYRLKQALCDIGEGVRESQALYPRTRHRLAQLQAQVGALADTMLEIDAGNSPAEHLREEAIEVAVQAIRLVLEGDEAFRNSQV